MSPFQGFMMLVFVYPGLKPRAIYVALSGLVNSIIIYRNQVLLIGELVFTTDELFTFNLNSHYFLLLLLADVVYHGNELVGDSLY